MIWFGLGTELIKKINKQCTLYISMISLKIIINFVY